MKVLYVSGDEYSAMNVDKEVGIEKAVKMTEEAGGSLTIEDDLIYAELSIKEFKAVDPEFVSFIKDHMIDYDHSKHTDFFVIEE